VSSLFAARDVIVALIDGWKGAGRGRGPGSLTQKPVYQFSGLFCFYLLFTVIASHLECLEPSAKENKACKYSEQNKANNLSFFSIKC